MTLFGRNFTGGTSVSFGGASALVLSETSDELRVEVPDYVPAGDVSVVAYNPGTIPSLAGLSFDLRATVTGLREASGGTALTVLDRASPPSALLVDGHDLGGAAVTLDGIPASAVDVLIVVGSSTVASVRSVTLGNPAADTIVGGPVVLWGQNGEPSETCRFLFVRD